MAANSTKKQNTRPRAEAVLIYAPAIVRSATSSADRVAEMIAATRGRAEDGSYQVAISEETAPRGLRLGRTVLDPHGKPVLEVFELDYRDRLADRDPGDRPDAPLGAIRSGGYAVISLLFLIPAMRRKSKTRAAKWQVGLGIVGVSVLFFAAIVTILGTLGALGLDWVPVSESAAVTTGVASASLWLVFRSRMLAIAEYLRQGVRYVSDEGHRNTVTQTLDDAVDGLLDAGWKCPIHVMGYSFGGLVLLDALAPRVVRPEDRLRPAVSSLVTIGCPADVVRLYHPHHFDGRIPRVPGLPWSNVYIAADVFGSNFRDKGDVEADGGELFYIGGMHPATSHRYTKATLSFVNFVFARGFSLHGGYWDKPTKSSCFDEMTTAWIPAPVPVGAPA